jgi:hypothetical protein
MILNLSIAEIHTNLPGVLNGTQVQLVVADSLGTKSGILRATRALASQGVAAIIGGVEATNLLSNHAGYVRTDTQGVGVGVGTADVSTLVWAANSLPEPLNVMLTSSSACQSAVFNDRGLFPYMNRMCTKLTAKAKAMLAASNAFGWKKIAVIAQDTSDGYGQNSFSAADPIGETLAPGQSEPDYLVSEIAKLNGEEAMKKDLLRIRLPSVTSAAIEQIPARLQQLKESGFRIIAVYLQGDMLVKFMRLAHAADMLRAPYVWVGAGSFAGPSSTMGVGTGAVASGGPGPGLCSSYMRQTMADLTPSVPSIDSSAGELISTYQSSNIGAASSAASYVYQVDLAMTSSPLLGVICFSPSAPRTPAFTNLRYRLGAAGLTMESVLGSNDATLYDSVLIHAKAFDSLIQSGATLTSSGIWSASDVNSAIKSVTTSSTSGTLDRNIRFDPKGDRYGSIDLFNYDPYGSSTGSFVRRGVWSEYSGNLTIDDALIWSDGTTSLPPDHVDQFTVGQVMPFSFDQRILAVAYFFVLLPSLMLVYNGRRLARMFLEAYSIPSATGEISTEWRFLAARSFALFSLPAVFAMIYLNILAIVFESGSFRVETGLFVGQIFLAFVAMVCIVPVSGRQRRDTCEKKLNALLSCSSLSFLSPFSSLFLLL